MTIHRRPKTLVGSCLGGHLHLFKNLYRKHPDLLGNYIRGLGKTPASLSLGNEHANLKFLKTSVMGTSACRAHHAGNHVLLAWRCVSLHVSTRRLHGALRCERTRRPCLEDQGIHGVPWVLAGSGYGFMLENCMFYLYFDDSALRIRICAYLHRLRCFDECAAA